MVWDRDDLKRKMIKTGKSIIFDRFVNEIDFHPIIIFGDDLGNLYYLKTRGVYDRDGFFRNPINNEILIKKHKKGWLEKTVILT
ncbi:hypothetical protein CO229_03060 [Mycoplasmopsis bovirhinis]|uniref:hypothetical protein n=1 Tax=Mycoplasmopsis bovirhinis TaxID=29553 RepID=UPI000C05B457|nr:hypothetical protein [Mycoplasmopsis bovirhinis]ATO31059.1 hypothetical protein CO229_03060 [Mycoplasmopsis bovirhinis]